MARIEITDNERTALERVFELAEGYSGTGLKMRRLLCSWWNAGELGGFHLSDFWSFDDRSMSAAMTVIQLIARLPGGTYADAIDGFGERMRAIATRRSRELELGAKYTFERWDETLQDWRAIGGLHAGTRYATRAEAEREIGVVARALSCKLDDVRVTPVWDEDRE